MSDYAEILMHETSKNLFKTVKDCEYNKNRHLPVYIEIAKTVKKLWDEENIEAQKKLINLLFKEIYIETLLRKALKEFDDISKNKLPEETIDFSNPKHRVLQNINTYTYNLLVDLSKLAHLSKDYKNIFCRFVNKTKILSINHVNRPRSFNEGQIDEDSSSESTSSIGSIGIIVTSGDRVATQMYALVELSKPKLSKLNFQTKSIRYFLSFFESEVLRNQ